MTGLPQTPVGAGSPFEQMTAALTDAFTRVVGLLLGFWTTAAPDPSRAAGTDLARRIGEYTGTLTVTAATIGVVVAGARMAVTSSRGAEPARDLLRGLGVLTAVWWGGVVGVRELGAASDEAGRHLLSSAGADPSSVANLADALRTAAVADPGLVFLLGLVGALSGLAQFVLLLLREPALALLAGGLPVAAGAAVSGYGGSALKRLTGWTAALVTYKFVAAAVFAAAFSVIGRAEDLTGITAGIALVVVAVAALPALVKVIAPAMDAALVRRGDDRLGGPPATGAVVLGTRGGTLPLVGPPTDAGPQTRPGLLAPSGSSAAPVRTPRPAPAAITAPQSAMITESAPADQHQEPTR